MSQEFLYSTPEAEGFSPDLAEKINSTAENDIRIGRITCADILVARHNKIVYAAQHGQADPGQGKVMQPEMIFRLASMSKPIIAVATLIQQDRGLLSVDDPVSRYIPEFGDVKVGEYNEDFTVMTGSHPAPRPVLIRDLLTHSSGIGSGAYYSRISSDHRVMPGETLETLMPRYASYPLEFDPGTATSYSGLCAFDILSRVVEVTSGKQIYDFLIENLFRPLGMESVCYRLAPGTEDRMVRLYTTEGNKAVPASEEGALGNHPTYCSGGGGMLGTVRDYYRFARMLLNGGEYDGVRILKEETLRAMGSEQVSHTLPGVDHTWTWGWGVRVVLQDNGSQKPLPTGAFGWSGAYGTHFWVDPSNDLAVIYMSNMTTAGGSGAITAREIERDVYSSLR